MDATPRTRRSIIRSGGILALATAVGVQGRPAEAADAVPFSAGMEPPSLRVPPGACDCHIHILSSRFPASPHWKGQPVQDSDVPAYRRLQARLGTSRVVVVTPSTYGIDNRATLDGVAQFGASARAVVVVDLDVPDAVLRTMATQGAVGIRVNFGTPQSWGSTTAERLEAMARKVEPSAGTFRSTRPAIRSSSWSRCCVVYRPPSSSIIWRGSRRTGA